MEENALCCLEGCNLCTKEFLYTLLSSPERGWPQTCWWRYICRHHTTHLAKQTTWTPTGQTNFPARSADAQQFVCGLLLIGSKHHSQGRKDHIERGSRKGEIFCVGLKKCHWESLSRRSFLRPLKERGSVINARYLTKTSCGCNSCVATTSSNIQHLLIGT